MKEYLRGTLEREPALVWLSVSESAVYQGGRGELCSIRRGDQETTKKGGRDRDTEREGDKGRKLETRLVPWHSLEYALSYYFLQQDPNSQSFQK